MRMITLAFLPAIAFGSMAAAPAPLKRTPLIEQPLPAPLTVRHVKGGRVEFRPGQPTGRHLHPAPVFGIVTAGSFIFQPHGQHPRLLRTGDAFYEPANVPIERFDNASRTAPAAIDAFYLLSTKDQPPIKFLPR